MPTHTKRTIGCDPYAVAGKPLSDREKKIACAFARGLSRNEIAKASGISVKTVDSHRLNILVKLGLDSTVALCRYAIEHSWIAVPGAPCSACDTLAALMDHHRH